MSKKAVLVLFAVCTLISVHPALASQSAIQGNIGSRTASQNAVFTDVASTYWAYPSIIELADHGIISGFPNGAFRPEGAITRAEFAKIIDLAFDLPASTTTGSSFSDIDYTYWAFKYIEAAKSSGVITGLPNKTFQADRRITRAEIAKMVISAGKFKINKSGTAFIDTADNWAHDYIMTARNLGIIGGYANNTFDPSRSATRAEAAKIIANSLIAVLGTKADNPDIPSIRITSPTNKDELTTADNTLQLAGTATDDKEITRVTWANGQGSEGVAKGTTSWTIPSIMLREGLNSITITAIDNTGNMATAVIRVTYTQRSGDYMDSAFAATIPTIDGVINPGEWPTHSARPGS